ncbi:MAG TPA: alkaline phosphatase D family protein [Longimicrobium sp.]|nr:alkaline phosphatase D family protein [Longimicrobium sp.]
MTPTFLRRTTLAVCVLLAACTPPPPRTAAIPVGAEPLSRIAFGSCSDENRPQPLWTPIVNRRPQLWIWLGDNVYADTADMAALREAYARARANPGYQALLAATPVIGTWDDHDFGKNDGGREWPAKAQAQQALLDFLDEPADTPRRRREGVYESYTYGPPGRQVKVILLDTRYHRDPRDTVNFTGDVLGEEQWTWLERELRGSTAQVHLVGSSIQVVPEEHRFEKWANFPAARERLFRLIGQTRAPGVVFISGDRHIAEISRVSDTAAGYPVYDVTSSGLTHTWREDRPESNRHRLGDKLVALNFGVLEIDWNASPVTLRFSIVDDREQVRLERTIPLSELQPR